MPVFLPSAHSMCRTCFAVKHDSEFYRKPATGQLVTSRCKECSRRCAKQWRKTNPEFINKRKTNRAIHSRAKGIPVIVLMDEEDRKKFSCYSYFFKDGIYPVRKICMPDGRFKTIQLARDILGMTQDDPRIPDHINGDPLDNRRCNLRITDKQGNNQNKCLSRNNHSGYPGVYWHKGGHKWHARGYLNRETIHLGVFDDVHEAGRVAIAWREKHYGCFDIKRLPARVIKRLGK